MKVKVIRKFRDKYTKEVYKAGQIIEVTDERKAEILSASSVPLVAEIPEPVEKPKRKSTKSKEE